MVDSCRWHTSDRDIPTSSWLRFLTSAEHHEIHFLFVCLYAVIEKLLPWHLQTATFILLLAQLLVLYRCWHLYCHYICLLAWKLSLPVLQLLDTHWIWPNRLGWTVAKQHFICRLMGTLLCIAGNRKPCWESKQHHWPLLPNPSYPMWSSNTSRPIFAATYQPLLTIDWPWIRQLLAIINSKQNPQSTSIINHDLSELTMIKLSITIPLYILNNSQPAC